MEDECSNSTEIRFVNRIAETDFEAASDCVASTNENSLKMLSILDFAGQSAYYACHHIFFSPGAFYILVVDMSKDLKSYADRACDKEGLIYSNWTYAGIQIYTFNFKSVCLALVRNLHGCSDLNNALVD